MKKMINILTVIAVLAMVLTSCGEKEKMESMEYIRDEDGNYGNQIKWGNTIYTTWSAADANLIEKQVGIVDGDRKEKVYNVRGYSSKEWLIHHYDVIMSTYDLYKADAVTDIPEEFIKLKIE